MIYISVIFLLTLFFYIFFIFGSFLNNKLNVINRYNFSDCIIFGYAVFTVITFHTFFIFGVSNIYLLFFLIIFIIYFHFKHSDLLINKSKNIYIYLILFITLSLFFLYPVIVSGEQFYVFRGNYWDSFNYLSSALLFHKHSYQSLLDSNIINNYLEFQSIKDIINYRPYITYILSFYLNIKFLDLFLLNYTFKILLSLLNVFAFFSFLDIFKNISSAKKIILSIIFSFSFFSIYIFEIDALSHLGSISLLILSLKYIYLLFENNKNSTKNVIFLSVINSALFIIYPEIFVFFFIIFSCYCFDQIILKKKKNYFKTLVIYLFTFFIFTIGSYNTNYLFLLTQISQALRPEVDWWGYFGSFILGRENLVLNLEYVNSISETISEFDLIQLLKIFYYDHIEKGYYFILLNIVPSFFGLYYVSITKLDNLYSYFILIICIILNINLLFVIKKNLIFLIKKYNFINLTLICFFIIISYLILRGNYWTVIKIYSYSLIFVFLFVSINFENKKLNKYIVLLLLVFPIYKYSSLDNGIGKIDSFPSIIKKNYKQNINWNLSSEKLKKCNYIFTLEKDYFVKTYIYFKALFLNKTFQKYDHNNILVKNDCKVSVIGKNFIVTSVE